MPGAIPVRMASSQHRSMSALSMPRLYFVTTTKWTWSAGNHMPAAAVQECHRPSLESGIVQVRYRYRIYPTAGQQRALARAFGCARVVVHDRDVNAARNILAAGRADKSNACGGQVRPAPVLAPAGEAGTLRGAA